MELFEGRMYWTDLDGGRLRSATLDGADITTIAAGLSDPRAVGIMVIPEPAGGALLLMGAMMVWLKGRKLWRQPQA